MAVFKGTSVWALIVSRTLTTHLRMVDSVRRQVCCVHPGGGTVPPARALFPQYGK